MKLALCGSARAKDANVRQAIIDRFAGVGGKAVAVGTKKNPGPLYGISNHKWSALALCITWIDMKKTCWAPLPTTTKTPTMGSREPS